MPFLEISNNSGITSRHDSAAPVSGASGYPGVFPGKGGITLILNPLQAMPRGMRDLLAGQGKSAPPPSPASSPDAGQQWLKNATGHTDRRPPEHWLKVLVLKS